MIKSNVWKKIGSLFGALLLLTTVLSATAQAYSYGDPNQELVAEVYKKMVAKLNESPPDFAGAQSQFETVKSELDMHIGQEPSASVMANLKAQNKEAVLRDMQKILVLNIARRLDNIEKDFQNYKQNKTLLAKSLASYDALSPVIKQKDPALDDSMRKQFEAALQSLGNPGLFGVGVKEPDPQAFKKEKDKILNTLQQQFGLKSLEVGHFAEGAGPGNEQNQNKQAGTDFSDLKNWIPIAVIVLALAGVVVYSRRKRRK